MRWKHARITPLQKALELQHDEGHEVQREIKRECTPEAIKPSVEKLFKRQNTVQATVVNK